MASVERTRCLPSSMTMTSVRARARRLLTCVSQREVMRTAHGRQRQEAEGTENSGCGDDERHSTRRPLTELEMTD